MDDPNDIPSNIVINGQEYPIEEAQKYIDKGRMATEYEQKWNTPLEKVWPEYGKSRETLKQVETERDDARRQLTDFQQKQQKGTETPTDIAEARKAAKLIGLTLDEDINAAGYFKKSELETYLSERDQKQRVEQDALNKINERADKLSTEVDGTDGRPKFNKKAVLAYAVAYKIDDLMQAYEEMHEDVIKPWKEAQIASKKNPSLKTLKPSGTKKEPEAVKVTNDNYKQLLHEVLSKNDE